VSRGNYLFTSESVSEGHPDKVCDRISDAVVDLYLDADPLARVACETLVTTNHIVLAGEVRGPESVTRDAIEAAARRAVREIGYEQEGFHWELASFENLLHEQSVDIAMGVDADADKDKDEGAGDQGIMFGYACRETDALMPAPIFYSHRILHEMAKARHAGRTPELGPDAKSQVTLVYENGVPVRADSVVVSTQHDEKATSAQIEDIVRGIVDEVLPKGWADAKTKFYVNPTGRFVIGGPDGDAGLTGRKIIVDTYGGAAPHGGGAFSGKDPTKVDRSAAYAARRNGLEPARHPRTSGAQPPDLRTHGRLWPFRTDARERRRLLLGACGPSRPDPRRPQLSTEATQQIETMAGRHPGHVHFGVDRCAHAWHAARHEDGNT